MTLNKGSYFSFKNNNGGFSAIEVLAVMAIVGIMAAMAGPSLKGLVQKGNVRDQALSLREAITRARYLASSRQECVLIQISGSDVDITAHQPGANKSCVLPLGTETFALPKTTIKAGYTISTFSNGTNTLVFNANGGLEEKSVTSVRVSFDTDGFDILIYPAIGQIRMR